MRAGLRIVLLAQDLRRTAQSRAAPSAELAALRAENARLRAQPGSRRARRRPTPPDAAAPSP